LKIEYNACLKIDFQKPSLLFFYICLAETTATEADTTTEAVTTTTTTTTSTAPVTKTTASTTSTTTTTTTTEESIDSCDFYEVKGGLLSCTCYNFSLQAIGIGGTFLSNKLFFTSETELTDSGDDVTRIFHLLPHSHVI